MAVEVPVRTTRTAHLRLAPDAAFAFLSDVPAWGALFPNVDHIAPLDGVPDGFVWTMVPIGPPGVAVAVVYACRYAFDAAAQAIAWSPVEGVGTGRFSGRVGLEERPDGGADAHLDLDAVLSIPAPAFIRPLVVAAVTFEFGRMMDTFAERLGAL